MLNKNSMPTLFSALWSIYNSIYIYEDVLVLFGAMFTIILVIWKEYYSSGFASLVMFYSTFNTPVFVYWMLFNFFVFENTLTSNERCIYYSKI